MNDFELENMREQMTTLKNKLNRQTIVNDRFIRQSMNKTAGKISHKYHAILFLCIGMIPYGYWCFVKLSGLPVSFWIATSIFMLVCAGATYYNSRNLNDIDMQRQNLIEVSRKMARAKKFDANWLFIGIPAVMIWMAVFFYFLYQANGSTLQEGIFWGGCIGGLVGATIGIRMHWRTQRQYQEIIDTIEDITKE